MFKNPVQFDGNFVFANDEIKVNLVKETSEIWNEIGIHPKHAVAKQYRQEAEAEYSQFYNKQLDTQKTNKSDRNRKSVNLCITKDENKRNTIDSLKSKIVTNLGDDHSAADVDVTENEGNAEQTENNGKNTQENNKGRKLKKSCPPKYSIELAKKIAVENENLQKAELIPPRCITTIDVKFTHRQFSNPARESKAEEEREWLRKQEKAKIDKIKLQEDLKMDHDEIVKKSQKLFSLGDFESAEEILNHGVILYPKSSQILNNRVAIRFGYIILFFIT